jgi:hypothetical protein
MADLPFLHYLWPGVLALLLLNITIGAARATNLVKRGQVTEEERRDFTRSAVLWSASYCLAQEVVFLASHLRNPVCLLTFPPHTRYELATWVVAVGTVAALLKRVWRDAAADVLVRIGPAFVNAGFLSGLRLSRRQVQVLVTVILLLVLTANAVGSGAAPPSCRASSAAA